MSFEKTNSEKDAIIAEKDKQIIAIQSKIDDMTNQFREMLQVEFYVVNLNLYFISQLWRN
jgi:hypothetical protein